MLLTGHNVSFGTVRHTSTSPATSVTVTIRIRVSAEKRIRRPQLGFSDDAGWFSISEYRLVSADCMVSILFVVTLQLL